MKFINSKLPNWPNPSSVLYTEPTAGIYYKDFVIRPINMGRENSKYGNEEMLMFFFLEAPSKNFFDKFFDNFF